MVSVLIYLFYFLEVPIITVNCSSPTIVVEGDNFACECKGTYGNSLANVTWYNSDGQIVAVGKKLEEATLVLSNVDKDDNGTYTCEAKSLNTVKNETTVALIVACKYDGYSSYVTVIQASSDIVLLLFFLGLHIMF